MLKRAGLLLVAFAVTASAQPAARRVTNLAALVAYPGFYHMRQVVVAGDVKLEGDRLSVSDGATSIRVVTSVSAPEGTDEVRGELWDLGRMKADDPQLVGRDLRLTLGIDPDGAWPKPGDVVVLMASGIQPFTPPSTPSIRAIVLHPSAYGDQRVTITGQFSGRNLFGELPEAPGRSRYDFVVRSADAAIWVSNVEPRGRDRGRNFELGLDARIDTNRWISVSGKVQQRRGLLWIEGEPASLSLASPPAATPAGEPIRVAPGPPPEVVFSTPTEEEIDVPPAASIRVQFSRDIDPATVKDQVRVEYLDQQAADNKAATTEFTTQYNAGNRVLEIRFAQPFEKFRKVRIALLGGILGTDKQPLKPWALTFSVGAP